MQDRYIATTIMIRITMHKQTELKTSNREVENSKYGKSRSFSTSTRK